LSLFLIYPSLFLSILFRIRLSYLHLYFFTQISQDPVARRAAAAALHAIAVRASNQFADGGSNNISMENVLPIAYIGRKDKDVNSYFQEIWDEGGQVASLAEESYFNMPLQEKLLPHLCKSLIGSLQDVSWDRRLSACATLMELCDTNILSPASRLVDKHTYDRNELAKRLSHRLESSHIILITCVRLIINSRIWTGKADLVKTTAKISSKWANSDFADDGQMALPIKLDYEWGNLFENDAYFKGNEINKHEDIESIMKYNERAGTSTISKSAENDNSSKSTIDFSEADEMLNSDNDRHTEVTSEIVT
jgi:hypothetical protein